MNMQHSDKRKSQGCPMPLIYFMLQMTIVSLVLYMAYLFHVSTSILLAIFFVLGTLALNKTSKVCARQKMYAHHEQVH